MAYQILQLSLTINLKRRKILLSHGCRGLYPWLLGSVVGQCIVVGVCRWGYVKKEPEDRHLQVMEKRPLSKLFCDILISDVEPPEL